MADSIKFPESTVLLFIFLSLLFAVERSDIWDRTFEVADSIEFPWSKVLLKAKWFNHKALFQFS